MDRLIGGDDASFLQVHLDVAQADDWLGAGGGFGGVAEGDRAVLGPATDGGYYLLGMKAPHPELFADIDWSTVRVAAQTRAAAQRHGLALAELAPWYDVDDPGSLAQLVRECAHNGAVAPSTAAWLERNGIARRLTGADGTAARRAQ